MLVLGFLKITLYKYCYEKLDRDGVIDADGIRDSCWELSVCFLLGSSYMVLYDSVSLLMVFITFCVAQQRYCTQQHWLDIPRPYGIVELGCDCFDLLHGFDNFIHLVENVKNRNNTAKTLKKICATNSYRPSSLCTLLD